MFDLDENFGDFTFRYYKNATWLLIFYHNITGKVYFDNETEAVNCYKEQKYSILYIINDDMRYNNKYEFMLQYGSSKTKYNRWLQDKNPLNQTEENVSQADGFEAIHLDYNSSNFAGLAKTSLNSDKCCINSLLNGVFNTGYWFYGIGQYAPCDTYWAENIPGDTDKKIETEVYLWIRVLPKYGQINYSFSQTFSCLYGKLFLLTAIFL